MCCLKPLHFGVVCDAVDQWAHQKGNHAINSNTGPACGVERVIYNVVKRHKRRQEAGTLQSPPPAPPLVYHQLLPAKVQCVWPGPARLGPRPTSLMQTVSPTDREQLPQSQLQLGSGSPLGPSKRRACPVRTAAWRSAFSPAWRGPAEAETCCLGSSLCPGRGFWSVP